MDPNVKIYKTFPDGMRIVEYEDSLAPALADMWNRSGEGWGGSFGEGAWTAGRVIADKAGGAFFNVYVAMKDGEALGFCSFDRYYKDGDTAYVHLLNVRPDHHGKKIGKELVLMCVNETIARGMPRLDIHTWPGNTKSVPLYKKCGFLLEDRDDTTHLCNFIPTVLSTELFGDFFEHADWYSDSVRNIDINPDGVKERKFEFFGYEWESGGQSLRVGFENSGRRIRLVETDDYRIGMTVQCHELAYGLSYPWSLDIANKTGKELFVEACARSDGVIASSGSWAESVTGEACFTGSFFVDAVDEEQDPWRMHPCVLADVSVNGKSVEFGLGIDVKSPVIVSLVEKRRVAKPGMDEDVYINIKNNLPWDASVRFTIPENPVLSFERTSFDVKLRHGRDEMLRTRARIKACGYACIPIIYDIRDDSRQITFTRPLHLVSQGLEGRFAFETDDCHGAANGMWWLRLDKRDNVVKYERIIPSGNGQFPVARLGKPFDDEFNIMKPADVRVTQNGAFMRLEADFVSKRFEGAILTEIYEIDAAGTLKRNHRVANSGKGPLDLTVKARFSTNIGSKPVFHYDGDFHKVADNMTYGFYSLIHGNIDENWAFDDAGDTPTGLYWPARYRPAFDDDNWFMFEFPVGALAPGQSIETEPLVFMCGVFGNFRDFRDYVLGAHNEAMPFAHNHLEAVANGGNPVITTDRLPLAVRNNRLVMRAGRIGVSSPDGVFPEEWLDSPSEEVLPEAAFTVPVSPGSAGIGFANFHLRFTGYEKDTSRALLMTDNTPVLTEERDSVLTVSNGRLRFSVDPGFSDAVYSLRYDEHEWFYSKYPAIEPCSWWNDFVGGIKTFLDPMDNKLVLREEMTAAFTTQTDNFGNVWSGIRADVAIEKFDEYKGMRYSLYYMTLPGVPVMCHFTRLENRAGRYLDAKLYSMLFLSGKEGRSDFYATVQGTDKKEYRLRFGSEGYGTRFDRLAAFSREGGSARPERLYVFKDSKRDKGIQAIEYNMNAGFCYFDMLGCVPDGGYHTTRPVFCILTEKDLGLETLGDLARIEF